MSGSGPAEAHHSVAPRVTSLLDDVDAGRGGHVLADDRVDAPCRLERRQPEWFGQVRHRRRRRRRVEPHPPTQEEVGIEVAEQQVGVGDGRLLAAQAVAGGAGIGTRASRPHLEQTELVDLRDAAAASTDLDHVDHRRLDRKPAASLEAMDTRRFHHGGHVRRAALDEARLGGGAPHVEGDHIAIARLSAEERGGQPASGGSRLEQPHGELTRHPRRGHASGGLHQVEAAPEAALGERLFQTGDVAVDQQLDIRVGGRRGAALVLAQLRHHLRREGDGEVGKFTAHEVLHGSFVSRVLVRVEKADGQRGHASRLQVGDLAAHLIEIDRGEDLAVPAHALVDLAPEVAGDERLGKFQKEVVDVVALLDPHLQRIAKAAGREEGRRVGRPLDDGVGHQRRAVDEVGDPGQGQIG